jgi:hypothetical protein
MTEIRANSKGLTKLLVGFHLETRHRLAAMSKATGVSQQQIIRSGVEARLLSLEQQYTRRTSKVETRTLAIVPEQSETQPVESPRPRRGGRKPRRSADVAQG